MLHFQEKFHQTLAILTVTTNEFCFGIGNGWVAPTLHTQQKPDSELHLTIDQCSWIASLEHIGKIFGALLSALLLDTTGRTPLLTLCSFTFLLMWLAILFTRSIAVIYVVRMLFGIASGVNEGTNSVYLGENTSPNTRGVFGTVINMLYHSGLLFAFIIVHYYSYNTVAIINTLIHIFCCLSVFWLVEPAQFLLMKGKHDRAEKNFMWLKGVNDANDVKNELEKIKQNVSAENQKKTSYKKIFTSPANYKSVLMILAMYSISGSTGYFPVTSYVSIAFSSTDFLSPNELTILFGVSQLIVSFLSSFVIEKFNRRTIMLVSYALVALVHVCTAILYYVQEHVSPIPYFSRLIFFTITLYASIYSFAYPTVFLMRSELLPLSVKAMGGFAAISVYSVMSFVMTKIFLFIFQNYGIYINFLIFSAISSVMVLFVYFVLPETRNKSLIEIQEILEKQK